MKLQIFLLFVIIAADDVLSSTWWKIKFPLKLLQSDVQAISQYHEKVFPLHAFVHWPDSISFSIERVMNDQTHEAYLKISGTFRISKMAVLASTYNAIYYRNGLFHVKEGKLGVWTPLLPETKVTYIQPKSMFTTTNDYLSIKYFDLNELKTAVEPLYFNNKDYVESVLKHNPVTFLATVPTTMGHFVEYTFWGDSELNTLADGKLRVLLGSAKKGKLTLTTDTGADRPVFDQRYDTFTLPENFDINSKPLEGVFGVRMATRGFLAEVHQTSVLMLNNDDLIYGRPIEKQHSMFVHDLLQKVQTVEPRYLHSKSKTLTWIGDGTTSVKFQVHGQVLIKSVNLDKSGHIDHQCPFTIEYANKGRKFKFGERWVDRIYTDDHKLWVEGEGPLPAHGRTVSLVLVMAVGKID